ncbi:MAG: nitrile hydratase subunit alpha [Pseudonocardia sediminis]
MRDADHEPSAGVPDEDHSHPDHSELGPMDARVRALESILVDKGYVQREALDDIVEAYETRIGPHGGARVVARAWTDPDYAARLAADATSAVAELGLGGRQGEHMVAVFDDAGTHHLVVCTLCSCYPWAVLGIPPAWSKSSAYRARAVLEPRAVLADFGTVLPDGTRIRVWDSTAEIRYLVVPRRPAGTEGWSEERLAELVTRDAMIGVRLADEPAAVGARS